MKVLHALFAVLVLCSCRHETETLFREELFTLQYGKLEDQLDVFPRNGTSLLWRDSIVMRDGMFYLSNHTSSKIMEFNSYGDLLSMYYNPSMNPEPYVLAKAGVDMEVRPGGEAVGKSANRMAYPYSFTKIGPMGVTRNRNLVVTDIVPSSRKTFDEGLGAMLSNYVLCFDARGELSSYLGQEGVAGNPFPYVDSLHVCDSDEIVTISRTGDSWIVYWYGSHGEYLFTVQFFRESLPTQEGMKVSMGGIFPDMSSHTLYLKLDYYSTETVSDGKPSVVFAGSKIAVFSVEAESFVDMIEVPKVELRKGNAPIFGSEEQVTLYDFLGASSTDHLFFLALVDTSVYELMALDLRGNVVFKTTIAIEDDEVLFKKLTLSREGILCAVLYKESEAEVVWWRSDKLLGKAP